MPIDKHSVVYVAGHGGLVGSAVWRQLQQDGFTNLVGWRSSKSTCVIATPPLML